MPMLKYMFCWSLRSGTIGIFLLGVATLGVGFGAASGLLVRNHDIIEGGKADYEEVSALDEMNMYLKYILSILVISLITHIMLIMAVASDKRFFLIPWLFVTMIIAVMSSVAVIKYGCMETDPGKDAAIYIFGLLFSVLSVYLWLCVLSFFQELGELEVKDEDTIALITADYNSPPAEYNLPPPYSAKEAA